MNLAANYIKFYKILQIWYFWWFRRKQDRKRIKSWVHLTQVQKIFQKSKSFFHRKTDQFWSKLNSIQGSGLALIRFDQCVIDHFDSSHDLCNHGETEFWSEFDAKFRYSKFWFWNPRFNKIRIWTVPQIVFSWESFLLVCGRVNFVWAYDYMIWPEVTFFDLKMTRITNSFRYLDTTSHFRAPESLKITKK